MDDLDEFTVTVGGKEVLKVTDYTNKQTPSGEITIPAGEQTVEFICTVNCNIAGENHVNLYDVSVTYDYDPGEEPVTGPEPVAVWVGGEFKDAKNAHAGLEIAMNGNAIDANGNILIGNDATTGATIELPANTFTKASVLVRYELASAGAPVANAAPAGVVSTDGYPIIPLCPAAGSSSLKGAYLNKNSSYTVVNNNGNYWPFSTEPTISSGEGYMLFSYHSELENPMLHGTALYVGSTIDTMTGGKASGLQWKGHKINKIGIGGPTTAGGAKPWKGMVIKGIAIFTDEWLSPEDITGYKFPKQGAVQPDTAEIVNGDGEPAGYIEGDTATITNFETAVEIPASVTSVRFFYGDNDITGAFKPLTPGVSAHLALNPEGAVEGVNVTPDLDVEFGSDMSFDVTTIAGLWYAVQYGDELGNGDIGGEKRNSTTPEQATQTNGKKTLSAPKLGDKLFYRIIVAPARSNFDD